MATSQEITGLYQELLGRAPDAGGLANYMKGSTAYARNSILGSAEYKARANTPTATPAPSAPASNPIIDFANKQKTDYQTMLDKQNAEQQSLFNNYDTIRKNQEALPALYSRLQTEAGIPGLSQASQAFKDQIYSVKDKLDRLNEDVVARTTGTLTTDAQRRRLQTAEADPLNTELSRLGNGLAPIADMLTSANNSVSTRMGLETAQQDRQLETIKMQIGAISDKFAREITGFTTTRETELSGILDKLQRDRALSDRDWQLAQTIAAEERAFAKQKSLAATQLASSISTSSTPTTSTTSTSTTPAVNYSSYISGGNTIPLNPNTLSQPPVFNINNMGAGLSIQTPTATKTSTPTYNSTSGTSASGALNLLKPGSTGFRSF